MAWNKIKSMFVVSDTADTSSSVGAASATATADDVLKELEKYQLPAEQKEATPALVPVQPVGSSGEKIDFQALYDQAGIPNTDEVEALERFLTGLDSSLPDTAKVAAAKAFLGAIGKAPKDVIEDAGRKITVVRAVGEAKKADTDNAMAAYHGQIAELERQIAGHRGALDALQKDLESVRSQCAIEESRLQGARMFFGHMGDLAAGRVAK